MNGRAPEVRVDAPAGGDFLVKARHILRKAHQLAAYVRKRVKAAEPNGEMGRPVTSRNFSRERAVCGESPPCLSCSGPVRRGQELAPRQNLGNGGSEA